MSWKDPIKPKVPSFDEVMGDSKSSSVPSFDDVMGSEKKNSSLSVGVDGQLKQSAPTTSVSQESNTPNPFDISTLAPKKLDNSQQPLQFEKPKENSYTPENNFGLSNLPVEKPISDNTKSVNVENYEQATDPAINSPEIRAEKEKVRKINRDNAVDNATQRALKIKGLTAQPGSADYNKQKADFQNQLASGDATVGVDNNGMIGLKRTTKGWENLKNGWNEAVHGAEDAQKFRDMSDQERVDFLNQNPEKLKPSPYIGETPNTFGSLTHLVGSSAPYMGKAAAGAAIGSGLVAAAPETGGASLAGLPTAMAFLMSTPDMINTGIQNEVTSRYQALKQQHPERSDVENMAEARQGELSGGIGGIVTNAAMMGLGMKNPIAPEAKSVISNSIKGVFKNAVEMGGISGGVTAAQGAERNLEGVKTSGQDILKKSLESFKENGTTGFLLSGLMHLPNILKSAFKYGLVKSENPETIRATVQANENVGQVPPGTTEKVMKDLNDYGEALKKVPDGLTPESQASVAGLIQKKNNIVEEAKTKDDAFKPAYKEKVDAINNQIADIQRTGKPLEHEVDEATGETYKKPTFDNIAAMNVKNLADKISKGKDIADPKELQTEHNFPEELEKQLNRISKEEKSSNKDKENPNTELSDNITSYLEKNAKQKESFKAKDEVPVPETESSITDKGTDTNIQTAEEKGLIKSESKNVSDILNIPQEEANVLTMLQSSKLLTPIEKKILYRQYRNGVMTENEISKYTHIDVADLKSGNIDKWAQVILDKTKGAKVNAEDIDFEELPTEEKQSSVSDNKEKIADIEKRRKDALDKVKVPTNDELFKKGNVINYNGEKATIDKVLGKSVYSTTHGILNVNGEDTDNYLLYQNGKQEALDKQKEINDKYDKELSELPKSEPITNKEVIPETNKTNQDAVQINSAGEMGAHTRGNESIGGNVEGSGVGQGQQGNEPTGESGQPPIIKEEGKVEGESPEIVSTKQRINLEKANEFKLPEVPLPKLGTDTEEIGKAKERIDTGKSNPRDIVSELLNDKPLEDKKISVNDRFDMQYYMLQLKQRSTELSKGIKDNEEVLSKDPTNKEAQANFVNLTQESANHADDYIQAIEANKIGSAIWGKSGNAMQVEMTEHGDILQRVQRIRDWYGNDVPPEIDKRLKTIQKNLDDANAKIADLREKYDKLSLEHEKLKIQKEASKKGRKSNDDFKKERKDIVEDIQKALKKARGQMSATIIPYANELVAISPHVIKLFKSYAEEGINKVEDIVDKIQKDIKEHLPLISKAEIRGILAGEYKEAKKPIERDMEFRKSMQSKANAMFMLRHLEKVAMNSKKNLYMKALDFIGKWERTAIFAFNTTVFMKLQSAALYGSFIHKPVEMLAGKGFSKIFPRLAKNAPIEGNENLQSLAKFYGEFINPIKFAKEALKIYTKGESQLTQELSHKHTGTNQYVYKNPAKEVGVYNKGKAVLQYLKPILEVYTNTHAVIKDPVKRATFEASMINMLNWYKKQGITDINHPLILENARQYAYKRAEYEIFQENNKLSGKINGFFNQLEKSGIIQSKLPGIGNTVAGNAKYTAAALYHFFVPIASVAINLTRRLGLGAALPYNLAKAYDINKGIADLDPEKADLILRQLKKGAVGAAYWTLGFYLHQHAGGIWNRFDPDKKKGDRLHSDKMKFGDVEIPKEVQHTTQLQAFQYGATLRNVFDHYKDDLGKTNAEAFEASIFATLSGLLDGIPPAKEAVKLAEGIQDPHELKGVEKDIKRSVGINKMEDLGILDKDETPKGEGGGASGRFKAPKQPTQPKQPHQ